MDQHSIIKSLSNTQSTSVYTGLKEAPI